jgi:hypothetical protein
MPIKLEFSASGGFIHQMTDMSGNRVDGWRSTLSVMELLSVSITFGTVLEMFYY